ncbi:MAG: TetR/AcrR family transcriptional regulator [Gammaproteobacteria bacterium]|nr:TetR/AcrR family transcriptional regulator [Gammaproteobacteria bacterium]NNJ97359.1 TetR/AcrR family transcriptional regulator [Gammaproteobacteria bacterium]
MSVRLPGPERRATILKAAQRLFAEKGYHGVSIDEIARETHVSPAILYRHFKSKQVLYDAVLHEMSAQRESYVQTVINSGNSFEDVLTGMTQVYINSFRENPDLMRIELHSLLDRNPATSDFFQNRWKSFTDYIEFSLNESLSYDQPNREITILTAGLMFQGMLREALIQKHLQLEDRLVDVSLEELSQELVRLFLRALGIEKSRLSRKAVISG